MFHSAFDDKASLKINVNTMAVMKKLWQLLLRILVPSNIQHIYRTDIPNNLEMKFLLLGYGGDMVVRGKTNIQFIIMTQGADSYVHSFSVLKIN